MNTRCGVGFWVLFEMFCQCKQFVVTGEGVNPRVAEEHCASSKFGCQSDGSGEGQPEEETERKVMLYVDRDAKGTHTASRGNVSKA